MPRQPATVTIDIETCKGCVLCVEVCPPRVLVMSEDTNRMGYRYPLLLDGCTGCELCYKICPDYCCEGYRGAAAGAGAVRCGGRGATRTKALRGGRDGSGGAGVPSGYPVGA